MDPDGESLKGTIELRIGEQAVRLPATLPRGEVALHSLLPLAYRIAAAVVDSAVADSEAAGRPISCRAGCGACCRQAVPIGPAEARRLSTLVQQLPEPRRSAVRARFQEALARLRKTDLLQRLADVNEGNPGDRPGRYIEWGLDYFRHKIACPFLEDESCSIHPERPLICREYLVTNPASECASLSRDSIRRVPIKASVSMAVRKLERDNGMGDWMPLVMALEWCEEHATETQLRPALQWIGGLQQLLGRKEERSPQPDIAAGD